MLQLHDAMKQDPGLSTRGRPGNRAVSRRFNVGLLHRSGLARCDVGPASARTNLHLPVEAHANRPLLLLQYWEDRRQNAHASGTSQSRLIRADLSGTPAAAQQQAGVPFCLPIDQAGGIARTFHVVTLYLPGGLSHEDAYRLDRKLTRIRIPKVLLEQTGLSGEVEISVKDRPC